jgi:hypothetical protein
MPTKTSKREDQDYSKYAVSSNRIVSRQGGFMMIIRPAERRETVKWLAIYGQIEYDNSIDPWRFGGHRRLGKFGAVKQISRRK